MTATISVFGVAQAGVSAVNIFGSAAPKNVADTDTNPVELGTKFNVQRSGASSAIRFYKSKENIGQHVGNLWNGSGQLLATVKFSSERSSGWQTANLAQPAGRPGVTYVVSYHTNVGRYSGDQYYFAGKGAGKYAVRALADGVVGRLGRLPLRRDQRLPDLHLPGHQLLRGRRLQGLTDAADRWHDTTTAADHHDQGGRRPPRRPPPPRTTRAPTTTTTRRRSPRRPRSVPCGLNIVGQGLLGRQHGVPVWTDAHIVAGESPLRPRPWAT